MKKIYYLLLIISLSNWAGAQVIDNNIQGYYQAKSDSNMYSFFEFDGNGKVSVAGFGSRDYFTKGDSLIIFPDKSIFKFKIKNNTLIGVSNWVDKETWIKKDTVVANNRKNEAASKRKAALLHEYYKISSEKMALEMMMDDTAAKAKKEKISKLCNEGLSKACMDYFGILLIEDQGLDALLNPEKKTKTKPLNPEIIKLGNKIIAQDEPEGYTLLGSYYFLLGQKEKAEDQWNKGAEKGSQKSALALIQLEME